MAAQLAEAGVAAEYEAGKLEYTTPATAHKYTWDFKLPNGIIVETKGIFDPTDRKKHILIREQNPEVDIRFVFTRSKATLSKASHTTYADWCIKNGFEYADKLIPPSWWKEIRKTK